MVEICVSYNQQSVTVRKNKATCFGCENPIFIYFLFWTIHPKHCRCRPCTFYTEEDYFYTRWHSLTHHNRYDSSERVIDPLQRTPLCNIQYTRDYLLGEIRTHSSNKWSATGFGWRGILVHNYKNIKRIYITTLFQVPDLKRVEIYNV
jgi:hypothetical protein